MQSIEKIGQRFWYMTPVSQTDRPILGMVVGNNKSLMIDAGNSEAHVKQFLAMLAEKQVNNPHFVVLTHWHWDHNFGLSGLKDVLSISLAQTKVELEKLIPLSWSDEALDQRVAEGTEIEFCSSAIKKEYVDHRDINITLPDMTFESKLEIDLGGVTCIIKHVGGDHSYDSVVVFVKEEKILFLGDCIYPDIFSKKRNYTIKRTLGLLEELEKFDADTYILSHWKPISKDEFQNEVKLLRRSARLCSDLNGNLKNITEAFKEETGRELTLDEIETIEYFVNGYEMTNGTNF